MRNIDTPIKEIRYKIFTEICKIAFESTNNNFNNEIEEIPYNIIKENNLYRNNIYKERAIISERIRLAMGMSLRPENKSVHITSGIENSNIDEKYYEPPLMQVIPSACDACESNKYKVSNICRGCVAHPCKQICPKKAISIINGKSVINQNKCIKCGKCKSICPYEAIHKIEKPCIKACGIKAIYSDNSGKAVIDSNKCVSCGMCMVNCPFGAISDKSQIFQLSKALREGKEIIAEIAPSFVGQFGKNISILKLKTALINLGFKEVYEVALGADIGAISEAHHYVKNVNTGKLPFLLTSCCPAWAMLAKKQFPDLINSISRELTPMVATSRSIKQKYPNANVVFIGPCTAKKLEASRISVRSDVDFVITFEELRGMFNARDIKISQITEYDNHLLHEATAAGKGYAIAGGVSQAIKECLQKYYPNIPINIKNANGLFECKKILTLAKAGKMNGYLIEGMGCTGGCIAGSGTNISFNEAKIELKKYKMLSTKKIPSSKLMEMKLE